MRHVLATRRTVPLDRVDEYATAWLELQASAQGSGVNAWLFRGTDHEDHFMEFLEWSDEGVPGPMPETGTLGDLRERLTAEFGHGHEDRWDEALLPEQDA